MSEKTLTAAERMAQVAPKATAVADIPGVVTITASEQDGRGSRSKFVGTLDEAGTVQVSLYFPEDAKIPKTVTLEVAGKGYDRFQSVVKPNARGSVKWAFGDLKASDSFGAACWVPAKAATHTIKVNIG